VHKRQIPSNGEKKRSFLMNTRLQAVVLLVLVGCLSQPGRATADEADPKQSPRDRAADVTGGNPFVSIITQPTGEPILVIKYPWKRHLRPSVEIRVLDPSEVQNPMIRPLFFVHDLMKGKVTTAVYHCQDYSEDVPQTATFSEGDLDFEIIGARNSLGRPAVCVACRTATRGRAPARASDLGVDDLGTGPETRGFRAAEREPETRAVFCLLRAWAVDERTLYLDLPAEYFSRPSKIRVWLMRDKDVVWTATAAWPGTPERAHQ
jgi:hypothetical protein